MSINNFIHSNINLLDILKKRKLNYSPLHFKKIEIDLFDKTNIEEWVKNKLHGRYYIVNTQKVDKNNRLKNIVEIGFEDESELTYFILACPHLRRNI